MKDVDVLMLGAGIVGVTTAALFAAQMRPLMSSHHTPHATSPDFATYQFAPKAKPPASWPPLEDQREALGVVAAATAGGGDWG